jgi:hypothetical protein
MHTYLNAESNAAGATTPASTPCEYALDRLSYNCTRNTQKHTNESVVNHVMIPGTAKSCHRFRVHTLRVCTRQDLLQLQMQNAIDNMHTSEGVVNYMTVPAIVERTGVDTIISIVALIFWM